MSFTKILGHKVNIQKSFVFLHANNKQLKKDS